MTASTPELRIEPQLPVLACNFEQLKAWATGLTERYANMVVTEDALVEVKKDMAELNRHKAKLEDARKETVRQVSEPIRAFEAQIKEVVGIFDAAYAGLSGQVKAFEEAQRNEKRKEVEGLIIEANMNAFGSPAYLPIPIQEKWLNKTASFKSIREDLAAIIDRHMEEEQRKKALAQARQDRAASIENHVVVLNKMHGLNLPLSRFLGGAALTLDTPLAQVLQDIEERFRIEADLCKAEERAKAALAACESPVSHNHVCVSENAKSEPQTRAMSIVLEYDIAKEPQVQACLATIKTLCVNFGARYR